MALLIDYEKGRMVTNFKDIQEAFAKHEAAQIFYWRDLCTKVFQFCKGLEDHLGLTNKMVSSAGRADETYLQVGYLENEVFIPVEGMGFRKSGLKLPFVIQVIAESAPEVWPKLKLQCNLAIGKEDGLYCIQFEASKGNKKFHIPTEFPIEQLRDVYESIARDLVESLDISKFQLDLPSKE